jgi:hypothetical protein
MRRVNLHDVFGGDHCFIKKCMVDGWMIRVLGFKSQWGLGIFLFTTS